MTTTLSRREVSIKRARRWLQWQLYVIQTNTWTTPLVFFFNWPKVILKNTSTLCSRFIEKNVHLYASQGHNIWRVWRIEGKLQHFVEMENIAALLEPLCRKQIAGPSYRIDIADAYSLKVKWLECQIISPSHVGLLPALLPHNTSHYNIWASRKYQ